MDEPRKQDFFLRLMAINLIVLGFLCWKYFLILNFMPVEHPKTTGAGVA